MSEAGSLTSRRVAGAGVELAVADSGAPPSDPDAPTVILVHGYPDNSETWVPVARLLEDRYRVVTYDVRGAGASPAPSSRRDYRLNLLVQDLAAVADAVCPDRPVHLVGHDWGSIQLWEAVTTASNRPDFVYGISRAGARSRTQNDDGPMAGRIASFTSISGPSLDHAALWVRARMSRPRPRALRQLVRQGLRSWYVGVFHLPAVGLFWRLGGAGIVSRAFRLLGELPADSQPSPTFAADGLHGVHLYRANVLRRARRPQRRTTDIPVQLIVPRNDRYVTPALHDDTPRWASNLWRRDVPGGHWIIRHNPDRVARWISELVDHVEGGPPSPGLRKARVASDPDRPDDGKVVVVTGAGSGIGRQSALAFAERGATVVSVDIDGQAAERTATLCRDVGADTADHYQVDVGDAAATEALAKDVEHAHGVADVVVNNAGIGMAGSFLATTPEDWEHILHVNLWGVIHGAQRFGQQMTARGEGGHIVNVASAAAFTPSRTYSAYATTKAAVLMLSECIRAELADQSIGVTAICPGVVNTGIISATRFVGVDEDEQARRRSVTNRLYARRGFGPDRVADAIVRSVETDAPVVPVAAEARAMRFLSRFAPRTTRRLARADPTGRL